MREEKVPPRTKGQRRCEVFQGKLECVAHLPQGETKEERLLL